jgi:hypothetical protein
MNALPHLIARAERRAEQLQTSDPRTSSLLSTIAVQLLHADGARKQAVHESETGMPMVRYTLDEWVAAPAYKPPGHADDLLLDNRLLLNWLEHDDPIVWFGNPLTQLSGPL